MSLKLRDVDYRVSGKALLRGVSLTLEPGVLMAIVGPNGSGKSTLLRVMAGDLRPSSGAVLLDNRPVSRCNPAELARRRAVLLQQSRLDFAFTVAEVAGFGLPRDSGPGRESIQRALRLAGVEHLGRRVYTTLSGGEQQRTQLARVLCQILSSDTRDARFLLLDEPTSALDLAHQYEIMSRVKALCRQGDVGVAVCLHDLNLAARYADHVVILKRGEVIIRDTPRAALNPATIREVFGIPVIVTAHPEDDVAMIIPAPLTGGL